MQHEPGTIEALAQVIASASKGVRPLSVVPRAAQASASRREFHAGSPSRRACIARIRFLEQSFGLGWMIQQATFTRGDLHDLDDGEIVTLLLEMERARQLAADGIPLEDGDFVRNLAQQLTSKE